MSIERPYIANNWQVGDVITEEKANNLEKAIANMDREVFLVKNLYDRINNLATNVNNNKVMLIKNSSLDVDNISNLIPDGDIVKYWGEIMALGEYQPTFWRTEDVIDLNKIMNLENGKEIIDTQLQRIMIVFEMVKILINKDNENKILIINNGHVGVADISDLL